MITAAQKKQQRLKRLNPKAWIGFLIGYNSSNIYRIWIPAQNKVISTRDVIFNEDELFSGNVEDLKDDLLHTSTIEFIELIERLALPETRFSEDVLPESTVEDDIEFIVPIGTLDLDSPQDLEAALDLDTLQNLNSTLDLNSQCIPMPKQVLDAQELYPTLEQTRPIALLAYSI